MTPLSIKSEIKRLHAFGFAIHHLKHKSKVPVKSGWTTGPRESIPQLLKEYKPGLNVGVRLGEASLIEVDYDSSYLAALDFDIRSSDKAHRAEAIHWLNINFPGLYEIAPITMSGRGNGSMHIWVRVKEPLMKKRLYASPDECVVMMPSAKPTPRQIEVLGQKKIKEGWRLRPAFEIDFMCEGNQVVLPPSIHPDTGRPYKWGRDFTDADSIPLVDIVGLLEAIPENKNKKPGRPEGSVKEKHEIVDVDESELEMRLPADIVSGIYEGTNVGDRSAYMMNISNAMVRAKFTDAEILGVLTNKDYFIGECAFEHAKTSNRNRAARWALDYSVRKSRSQLDSAEVFNCEVKVYDTLSPEAMEEQQKRLVDVPSERDWKSHLDRTNKDDLKPTFKNIKLILKNEVGEDVLKFNEFSKRIHYGCSTPWGRTKGELLADVDAIQIKAWLTTSKWGIDPIPSTVQDVCRSIAHDNIFHPVRDYLGGLEWDGTPRLKSWLKDYLGAQGDERYLSTMSEIFMVAAVARIFKPGIKYEYMIIFEGEQGVGKSTVGKILAGDEWFFDTPMDLHDKDYSLSLQGQWIVEMGELANLRKADVNTIKNFLSRSTDKFRPPFERSVVDYDRQCVFFGTTNDSVYLKDYTGNRRFYPIKVGKIDLKGLRAVRDQLWAEAVMSFDCGTKIYLGEEDAIIKQLAKEIQDEKIIDDTQTIMNEIILEWKSTIEKALKNKGIKKSKFKFKLIDLFEDSLFSSDETVNVKAPLLAFKYASGYDSQMASIALRQAGLERYISTGKSWWRFKE
jgi:predicted P-loop ATPase